MSSIEQLVEQLDKTRMDLRDAKGTIRTLEVDLSEMRASRDFLEKKAALTLSNTMDDLCELEMLVYDLDEVLGARGDAETTLEAAQRVMQELSELRPLAAACISIP